MISKDDIQPMLKLYGFESIDDAAFMKVLMILDVLIYNMLNNVLYVTTSLKLKTIKKAHFDAVIQIMMDYSNGKVKGTRQSGGGLVLPAQYFGYEDHQYVADVMSHNTAYIDGMTRGPLLATFPSLLTGGARSKASSTTSKTKMDVIIVPKKDLQEIIEKYKKEHNVDFKVASEVYEIICASIDSNFHRLFKACSEVNAKTKKVTANLLYKTLEKNGNTFAHMSYVWKL